MVLYVTEGMDSSATDSGTEDVLSSQMLSGPVHNTMSRDDRQPRQYKTKAMVSDGDWLTERNAHQNKVVLLCRNRMFLGDAGVAVQCEPCGANHVMQAMQPSHVVQATWLLQLSSFDALRH